MLSVVIVLVGGVGYAVLSSVPGTPSVGAARTVRTCLPPTNPTCPTAGQTDVWAYTSYRPGLGETSVHIEQGQSIPVTVGVTGGEAVDEYSVNWGDGTYSNGTTPTQSHEYVGLGSYVISAEARVGTVWHTGPRALIAAEVGPSLATNSTGRYPALTTALTNGSAGGGTDYGWIRAGGGPISVNAAYASDPLNPSFTPLPPSISGLGCTSPPSTTTGASATCTYPTAGIYRITFIGPVRDALTAPVSTIYQNYTWDIYVSALGIAPACSSCAGIPVGESPHTGSLEVYEVVPGGGTTTDANLEYDPVSAEPLLNVYQTLLTYNGSAVGPEASDFAPELAICVPGSVRCGAMYPGAPGLDLVVNNGTTGTPQYYTVPIDPNARFYDPFTGLGWPVYPSDVMFSIAREVAYGGASYYPGWIIGQALLPNDANGSWDLYAGYPLHDVPYGSNANNTAPHILASMLINDSAYCPQQALAAQGCITFDAWGAGHTWADFLELLASAWGSMIVPCGWYSHEGAGLPGWPGTTVANGDGPCLLPGNAKSTSDTSFKTWLAGEPPTAWDTLSIQSLTATPYAPDPKVANGAAVGSGPYYLVPGSWTPSLGYDLRANPVYFGPTCAGETGCYPVAGAYAQNVTVFWESNDQIPLQEYLSGTADTVSLPGDDTGVLLQLVQSGRIGLYRQNTLVIHQIGVNLYLNVTVLNDILPHPANVPDTFFAQVGLRQFLVHAFPYSQYINTTSTVDGVQFARPYGGVIPRGIDDSYPTNISWPAGDPLSNPSVVGSAAWWWAQATNSSSPTYDPQLTACTTSSPCVFPVLADAAWANNITSISGGRLEPYVFDVYSLPSLPAFAPCPYGCPIVPFLPSAWAPDYPDASDYVNGLLSPNPTFFGQATPYEVLCGDYEGSGGNCNSPSNPYNSSVCQHWGDFVYWAHQLEIPTDCQYSAYEAMLTALDDAAGAVGTQRTLDLNLAEHILNGLALYVYTTQSGTLGTYASWIDPSSINTNVMIGGYSDQLWFEWRGNGVL